MSNEFYDVSLEDMQLQIECYETLMGYRKYTFDSEVKALTRRNRKARFLRKIKKLLNA